MPTKIRMPAKINHIDTPQLWILNPDGTKIMLGDIQAMNAIADPCDICGNALLSSVEQEWEMTVRFYPNTKTLYFMLHGKFPSNNWLRMHGYKSERRSKCGQVMHLRKRA